MESKMWLIGLVVVIISGTILEIAASESIVDLLGKQDVSDKHPINRSVTVEETLRKIYGDNATLLTSSSDELLGKFEKSDKLFIKKVIGDTIVYRHQRMIDDAIVEGDRIVYQFDKDTKELKKKIIHWRDDLPEHLPPVISKEQAESIAGGGSATL